MEIIPRKVHTNDFYSRVAMRQKKTNKWAKRSVENFVASQPVNKNRSNAFHMVWCFSFHTYWDFFHISIQRLKANDCENTVPLLMTIFTLQGTLKFPINVVKTSVTLKADFSLYFPTRKVNFVSFFIAVSPCDLIGS